MKKLIIILGVLLLLGGLAFALSNVKSFQGFFGDEAQVLLDGAVVDDGSADDPVIPELNVPGMVNPPDGPNDPGFTTPAAPEETCEDVSIRVKNTADEQLEDLQEIDFMIYEANGYPGQKNSALGDKSDCKNQGYEYSSGPMSPGSSTYLYNFPLPIDQDYVIEAAPDGYVADDSDGKPRTAFLGSDVSYVTLTLEFGVLIDVENAEGAAFTGDATVTANGNRCSYVRTVAIAKEYGCRAFDRPGSYTVSGSIAYTVSADGYASASGSVETTRRRASDNPQKIQVRLNPEIVQYYAYLDIESDAGTQIARLAERNFAWRGGAGSNLEEDVAAQGNYWFEISDDHGDDVTVTVDGYETGGATIMAYSSKATAKSHPQKITLTAIAAAQPAVQYYAYLDIESTTGDQITGLRAANFDLRSGATTSLEEDTSSARGNYWIEIDNDQGDEVTVSATGYEDNSDSIGAYASKADAKSHSQKIVLTPIVADTPVGRVCSSVTLTPGSLELGSAEASRTLSLSVDATFRDETLAQTDNLWAYVQHFVSWMGQASISHVFVASTTTPWSGTMRIEIQGAGKFPAVAIGDNQVMEGPMEEIDFPDGATYEAHEGDFVSVELSRAGIVECEDHFTVTKAAAAVTPTPTPTTPSTPSVTEAYLVIELLDENDDPVDNVKELSFDFSQGDDNDILDFDEYDDGLYLFKMGRDTYDVEVDVKGYVPESESDMDTYSSESSAKSNPYTIVLSQDDMKQILSGKDYECDFDFSDIKDDLICRMREAQIFRGYPNGTFGPSNYITEAEALATMLRARGYTEDDAQNLRDVQGLPSVIKTEWYYPWYKIAQDERIIRDYANPNGPIRRATYAVLAARTWNKELRGWNEDDIDFKDVKKSMPETYAIILMNNTYVDVPGEGLTPIIEGYNDDTFRPNNNILRKDAAYLLYRVLLGWELEIPIETKGLSF